MIPNSCKSAADAFCSIDPQMPTWAVLAIVGLIFIVLAVTLTGKRG